MYDADDICLPSEPSGKIGCYMLLNPPHRPVADSTQCPARHSIGARVVPGRYIVAVVVCNFAQISWYFITPKVSMIRAGSCVWAKHRHTAACYLSDHTFIISARKRVFGQFSDSSAAVATDDACPPLLFFAIRKVFFFSERSP